MRSACKGYKNFLRMRIDKDKLTIFPIGLSTRCRDAEAGASCGRTTMRPGTTR